MDSVEKCGAVGIRSVGDVVKRVYSPVGNLIVLQKLPPLMLARQKSREDWIANPRGGIDLIKWRVKVQFFRLRR